MANISEATINVEVFNDDNTSDIEHLLGVFVDLFPNTFESYNVDKNEFEASGRWYLENSLLPIFNTDDVSSKNFHRINISYVPKKLRYLIDNQTTIHIGMNYVDYEIGCELLQEGYFEVKFNFVKFNEDTFGITNGEVLVSGQYESYDPDSMENLINLGVMGRHQFIVNFDDLDFSDFDSLYDFIKYEMDDLWETLDIEVAARSGDLVDIMEYKNFLDGLEYEDDRIKLVDSFRVILDLMRHYGYVKSPYSWVKIN